ncbi:hypothetical protein EAY15_19055, partial [Vibrio anguillarum]|uniref:hypothetical protein n=1 Tax=Vibrio anguillarum TaxID=55601 RepID=UPI001EC36CD9|nr:hypothetical protein [Vibrio anguillarum]MBF4405281.1 hypothetical protein [Vibrio anguillarum]
QRVAALVQNLSSVFTVCFLSSAVRCQPLSRALCYHSRLSINGVFYETYSSFKAATHSLTA